MSETIISNVEYCEPIKCHLMPFTIEYGGPASVSNYFETTFIKKQDSDTIESSFRARPLKGKQVQLPSGYTGAIIKRQENNFISTVGEFEQLYYWKYDEEPSQVDPLPRSLDWFTISSALHD